MPKIKQGDIILLTVSLTFMLVTSFYIFNYYKCHQHKQDVVEYASQYALAYHQDININTVSNAIRYDSSFNNMEFEWIFIQKSRDEYLDFFLENRMFSDYALLSFGNILNRNKEAVFKIEKCGEDNCISGPYFEEESEIFDQYCERSQQNIKSFSYSSNVNITGCLSGDGKPLGFRINIFTYAKPLLFWTWYIEASGSAEERGETVIIANYVTKYSCGIKLWEENNYVASEC
ncbi:hypothetical protein [Pseudovibrio sp. POLY-S9]|uniref:hypothetical protein n=1 Tax=Pseudovibrio sp. POLY-S9 TaxID=1576596 RepID=UPI000710DEC6|nr:hypothetical protein [Pseudovibrio sp. POLY-S9]